MDKLTKLILDIGKLWENYHGAYFTGIQNTLILAVAATLAGCLIGLVCGVLNTIPCTKSDAPLKRFFLKLLRAVIRIYVEVFRGTPMVLQAVFIFYGLPYFTDGAVAFKGMAGIWAAALIVVSINTGAYMAESVRGGIISIDPGQTEGAKAIGMTHVQTMVNVIMPQALRNIIPQIGNNFLYFPSAVIVMVGYLTLTLLASFGLRWLEKWLDGDANYELVSDDALAMSAGTYSHPDRSSPFDEQSKEFKTANELKRQRRERKLLELRFGRPKGDR